MNEKSDLEKLLFLTKNLIKEIEQMETRESLDVITDRLCISNSLTYYHEDEINEFLGVIIKRISELK